ncbi:cytochrome P450 2K4-like isoform X1 [Pelodiscus sinensis]|uniref:Cytochrome P450 2K6-like n=1 Tax=Pelodiscus sinensis TaxID=13735 RepID=K7G695_PELSI|nr:cytochrome P450 2K6-like [Pelodiscus sinensis]XP_025034223.1 cytochrome P450 2K6-like [Pelodiscus sinensis]|eukprot:XP_006137090.1 cytochrome P450 2K6-like [Pelodiscus sinensis]
MEWPDPTSIFLVFVLTIIFIMKTQKFWNSSFREDFPPGPTPLPIIGNLHILDRKRPYWTLLELSKKYGPVFSIQMGCQKMVVLSGYKMVKEALVNQADAFAERPKIPVFEATSKGYGVIFSHGNNWKVMRRFTLMTLRDFGMGKRVIEDRIVEESEFLIKEIESRKGQPFEITTVLTGAVANIIVSILLGERLDYKDPTLLKLLSLISENARVLGSPSVTLYNIFPALGFLLKNYKTFLRNTSEMHSFIRLTFIECLKVLDKNDQRSFIDAFLVRQQEEKSNANGYFHNSNLIVLANNLFAAGMETSSTTLRWGLLLMMKYPKIQSKVQEEIASVIGSAQPRIEHRTKMPYTDAVVHEIQRFANILPMSLPHETTEDVTLKGYFIPKGTYIIPLLASVLRDESQWEKPDTFNPEHFLDSEGKFVKKEAFMPFSAGRRICAGENLAKMELFLFFTSLLQRFSFHPPPGVTASDLDLTPAIGITTPPMPYKLCAEPRS